MYKTKENKLNALERIAIAKLLKGQEIDINCHYIQLYVNPTFTDQFVLQFELFENYVNCYCITWKSELDRFRIYTEHLEKELPEPTLLSENKKVSKDAFKYILDLVNKTTICPYIEEDWGDYRDGEVYTLTIGYKGCVSNYTWHYLPNKWDGLEQITDVLLEFNRKLNTYKEN